MWFDFKTPVMITIPIIIHTLCILHWSCLTYSFNLQIQTTFQKIQVNDENVWIFAGISWIMHTIVLCFKEKSVTIIGHGIVCFSCGFSFPYTVAVFESFSTFLQDKARCSIISDICQFCQMKRTSSDISVLKIYERQAEVLWQMNWGSKWKQGHKTAAHTMQGELK